MFRRRRLEAKDPQGLQSRRGRLSPLPGRQRHPRRACNVGLAPRCIAARHMSAIYLPEADVGRLVSVKDAITVLEELFATWGQPLTANIPRRRARLPAGALNLMGAAYGAKDVYGLKAYAAMKNGQ